MWSFFPCDSNFKYIRFRLHIKIFIHNLILKEERQNSVAYLATFYFYLSYIIMNSYIIKSQ